jgi:glycerol-3-phosphate acyltransferase PlsY
LEAALIISLSYLIGAIPVAYIVGRVCCGIDIRKVGDGNVGAANVFREISAAAGLFVMVADILKGAAVVLIAQAVSTLPVVYLAGLAAAIGHILPVYIGFRGGRGEATVSGVLAALLPQAMLILLAFAIVPFIITRNTMLLGAILFVPLSLVAWLLGASGSLIAYSIGMPCVVGVTHLFSMRHLSPEIRRKSKYMRRNC